MAATAPFLANVGAGSNPSALHCVQEAAEHDRLSSATYQRLNLALMWWGFGTALTLWLAPQQPLRLALGCGFWFERLGLPAAFGGAPRHRCAAPATAAAGSAAAAALSCNMPP